MSLRQSLVLLIVALFVLMIPEVSFSTPPRTLEQQRQWGEISKIYNDKMFDVTEKRLAEYLKTYPDDTEAQALLQKVHKQNASKFYSFITQRCDEFSRAGGECQIEIDSTLFYLDQGDSASAWPFYKTASQKYSNYCNKIKDRLLNLVESAKTNFEHEKYKDCIDSLNIFLQTGKDGIGYDEIYLPRAAAARTLLARAKESRDYVDRTTGIRFSSSKNRIGIAPMFTFVSFGANASMSFGRRIGGALSFTRRLGTFPSLELVGEIKYGRVMYAFGDLLPRPEVNLTHVAVTVSLSYDLARYRNGTLFARAGGGPAFVKAKGRSVIRNNRRFDAPSFSTGWPCMQFGVGFQSIGISRSSTRLSLGAEAIYSYCKGDNAGFSWDASNVGVALVLSYHL